MKTKIALILSPVLLLLLSFQFVEAQEKYSIGYFRSNPIGDYRSTDYENGSFAETGWGVMLQNKSSLPNWPEGLSLGLHLSYQENPINFPALSAALDEQLDGTVSTRVSGGRYNPFVVAIGPFYDLAIGEIFSIGVKTGFGVMFTNIDPIVIDVFNDQNVRIFNEVLRFEGRPAITYLFGLKVGAKLSQKVTLGLFADHSAANEPVQTTSELLPTVNSVFRISYINTGVSLSFGF